MKRPPRQIPDAEGHALYERWIEENSAPRVDHAEPRRQPVPLTVDRTLTPTMPLRVEPVRAEIVQPIQAHSGNGTTNPPRSTP